LALDDDHDGRIEPKDIIRIFGNSVEIDYKDLEKIISERANGKPVLNYSDFSKWMGNAIQQAEGYYFRHDSKKNPEYTVNL
jgi:Ca2+-binding EF-hand superfamily protein